MSLNTRSCKKHLNKLLLPFVKYILTLLMHITSLLFSASQFTKKKKKKIPQMQLDNPIVLIHDFI